MANRMAPSGSMKSGNSRRISASKKWCFTFNNYCKEQVVALVGSLGSDKSSIYIFQEEIGEEGTPHLQGFVQFGSKRRPIEYVKIEGIHWEKAKGSLLQNVEYCSKESFEGAQRWVQGIVVDDKIKIITELRPWQKHAEKIAKGPIDDRLIYWYWEGIGNTGKSALVKYLCYHYNALLVSGKGTDMKYLVVKYKERTGGYPKLILFDIPRTSFDYISWTGIEEVKNGCFASTKYECESVVMNNPTIICFANREPPLDKEPAVLSYDRWNVVDIEGLTAPVHKANATLPFFTPGHLPASDDHMCMSD